MELLLAIAADQPQFLLSGQTLADQGLLVTGMLDAGWTPEQLRQIIAGRPLPVPVRTTVGAVVASRLREAAAGPAPSSVPRIPAQLDGTWWPHESPADATPTPATWAEKRAALDAAVGPALAAPASGTCPGHGEPCDRPVVSQGWCRRHRIAAQLAADAASVGA